MYHKILKAMGEGRLTLQALDVIPAETTIQTGVQVL